jgi:hypothetical protein
MREQTDWQLFKQIFGGHGYTRAAVGPAAAGRPSKKDSATSIL